MKDVFEVVTRPDTKAAWRGNNSLAPALDLQRPDILRHQQRIPGNQYPPLAVELREPLLGHLPPGSEDGRLHPGR